MDALSGRFRMRRGDDAGEKSAEHENPGIQETTEHGGIVHAIPDDSQSLCVGEVLARACARLDAVWISGAARRY